MHNVLQGNINLDPFWHLGDLHYSIYTFVEIALCTDFVQLGIYYSISLVLAESFIPPQFERRRRLWTKTKNSE